MTIEVSVITPCFNSKSYILNCIKSVQAQTGYVIEHIIIDDYSSDDTYEFLQELIIKYNNIILLRTHKNIGTAKARNLGLLKAKGRFIAFLDADDRWLKNKFIDQISFMKEGKIPLSCTGYSIKNEKGRVFVNVMPQLVLSYNDMLYSCDVGLLTVIIDRAIVGNFEFPDMRSRQDYALWLKLLRSGYLFWSYQKVTALCQKRSNSLSANKFKAIFNTFRVLYYFEKLGAIKSLYYSFFHIVNARKKYSIWLLIKSIFT
jgi:teichuronic acid biosynthesis glycosyltransferase TuaG